jgi:hypothetical protein
MLGEEGAMSGAAGGALWLAAFAALAGAGGGTPPSSVDSGPGEAASAQQEPSQEPEDAAAGAGYDLLRRLLSPAAGERRAAAERLIASGDRSLAPGLVDLLFFLPRAERADAVAALAALTGERRGERYHDWVEVVGRRPELRAKTGYLAFKGELFGRIDPRYRALLYAGAPARIRVEEIVFGGVPVEGIPALDRPAVVPAAEAGYLDPVERVFGVSAGGAARAYPLRILDWHEMVNDVVGGEPITLSYCTLCGSGVLYATRDGRGGAYTFGTSGLLYRSNKLMLDRETRTLWSNLTGEAVLGRLAAGGVRLPVLPLTITTWGEWRSRHPATTVLALDRERERKFGYRYVPGAANRHRAGVSFPAGPRSALLDDHAEIYAVRLEGAAKAYPLDRVLKERVINDQIETRFETRVDAENVVLVADSASGAVRAYRRGVHRFAPGAAPSELVDEAGGRWRVEEDALEPMVVEPDRAPLPRLAGHQAFWFGWHAFFPQSEVYGIHR